MYKARKLLFVAALVAPASSAFADPTADAQRQVAQDEDEAHAAEAARGPAIYAMIDRTPYRIEVGKAPEAVSIEEYGRWIGATQPLTGANGRPACGNVLSKGPSPCDAARLEVVTARRGQIEAKVAKAVAASRHTQPKTRRHP